MKTVIILIAFSASLVLLHGKTPPELRRLQEQREQKFQDINRIYVRELEALKIKYTKQGNLEIAVEIDKEIQLYKEKTTVDEDQKLREGIIGRWLFSVEGSWRQVRTFKDNGFWYDGDKKAGKYKIVDSELKIYELGEEHHCDIFTLPVTKQKITGRHTKGWKVFAEKL